MFRPLMKHGLIGKVNLAFEFGQAWVVVGDHGV